MKIVRSVSGKNIGKVVKTMGKPARPIIALLSVLLLATSPVNARPVAISEVLQAIGNYQNPPELRLRAFTLTAATENFGSVGVDSSFRQSAGDGSLSDTSQTSTLYSDSLLSGVAISTHDPQARIDTIAQGDIQGTICDCGEIIVPGGLPKWPLLFLAAIPFFFIDEGDEIETPLPTPTPNPTPTPTPEPASLLLFGSGLLALGASFRRRYSNSKLISRADTTEEG